MTQEPSCPEVSIIVLCFNPGEWLEKCVHSVLSSDVTFELFVADNGSTDGSVQRLREKMSDDSRIIFLDNGANLGFAKGNNQVLPKACGRYVLLLNPDCVIEKKTLSLMVAAMDAHSEAGIGGCLVRNLDGTVQASTRRRIPTPWRSLVRVLCLDRLFPRHKWFQSVMDENSPLPKEPTFIEGINGAFMFARKEALDQVGYMDERYFIHCEDFDWFLQFQRAGWKVLFVPDAEAIHEQGACSKEQPLRIEYHKHRSMVKFYNKFFRTEYPFFLMWAVILAVWVRFGLLVVCHVTRLRRFAHV